MPPRVTFTKEEIIGAAFELVRREGSPRLTARKIAAELKCSTQPIYRVFSTIEELETAVINRSMKSAVKTMVEYMDSEGHFLSIGLGYLHFAHTEPHLFHLLFMSGKKEFDPASPDSPLQPLFDKMRLDSFLKEFDDAELRNLFQDMFIYTHGLCTLRIASGPSGAKDDMTVQTDSGKRQDPDPNERTRLLQMGGKLIAMMFLKKQNNFNIEQMMRSYHDENCSS